MRALFSYPPIHWQGSKEGQEHKNECGKGRKGAGCEKRNTGLVTEGRKVIDPGEAHHLPPGVFLMPAFRFVRAFHFRHTLVEPFPEPADLCLFHSQKSKRPPWTYTRGFHI